MADVLASSLVANLCTGGAVLAVFSVALKFPQFAWAYTSRSDDERRKAGGAPERFCKRPEPLRPGLLGWLVMVFYVRERDVLDSCGPDAVLHLRILQLGYRAFSKILMVAIILILPTSLWLTRESGGDSFHRFGISAVPQGSSLLWVHFTANIWVNIICMRGIWKFMKGWVELRHEYLEALHSEGGGRTLIVQGVPTEYQDESAFHRYWKNTYHSAILRTLTGKNTNLLEKKVAEREKVVAALERAVAEWHVKKVRPTHRPTTQMHIQAVDSIDYYSAKLKEANDAVAMELRMHRTMYLPKSSNYGFVTFKTSVAATSATLVNQSHDVGRWENVPVSEPRDVDYSNLPIPVQQSQTRTLGVYGVLFWLVFFWSIPVSLISSFTTLERLAGVSGRASAEIDVVAQASYSLWINNELQVLDGETKFTLEVDAGEATSYQTFSLAPWEQDKKVNVSILLHGWAEAPHNWDPDKPMGICDLDQNKPPGGIAAGMGPGTYMPVTQAGEAWRCMAGPMQDAYLEPGYNISAWGPSIKYTYGGVPPTSSVLAKAHWIWGADWVTEPNKTFETTCVWQGGEVSSVVEKGLFPFLKPILERSPAFAALLQGYLPSLALYFFMSFLPSILAFMAKFQGLQLKSMQDIAVLRYLFYFQIINVFFVSLISGGVWSEFKRLVSNPDELLTLLATAVPRAALFFASYTMLQSVTVFPLELLQINRVIYGTVWKRFFCYTDRERKEAEGSENPSYGERYSLHLLIFVIGMVYCIVQPMVVVFVVGYFFGGYITAHHQLRFVFVGEFETGAMYWVPVFPRMIAAMIVAQITVIGVFLLKGAFYQGMITIALPIAIILFYQVGVEEFYSKGKLLSIERARDIDIQQARKERKLKITQDGGKLGKLRKRQKPGEKEQASRDSSEESPSSSDDDDEEQPDPYRQPCLLEEAEVLVPITEPPMSDEENQLVAALRTVRNSFIPHLSPGEASVSRRQLDRLSDSEHSQNEESSELLHSQDMKHLMETRPSAPTANRKRGSAKLHITPNGGYHTLAPTSSQLLAAGADSASNVNMTYLSPLQSQSNLRGQPAESKQIVSPPAESTLELTSRNK